MTGNSDILAGLATRLRGRYRWLLVAAAFVVIRVAIVWGRPIARFPDSGGYFDLDFTGSGTRLWPVPFVYSLVTDDTWRVAVHVVASCAAWLWLAWAMARAVPRLRRSAIVATLALGATPQVARWDLTILSESIGLSIAVAMVAAWLTAATPDQATPDQATPHPASPHRVSPDQVSPDQGTSDQATSDDPTTQHPLRWYTAAGLTALFGMTRTPQVPVLALATAAIAGVIVISGRRGHTQPVLRTVLAGLIVATALATLQLRNNDSVSTLNFYTIMSDRVIGQPERREWFIDHGMPWNDTYANSLGYVYRQDLPPDLLAYLELPEEQAPPAMMLAGGNEYAVWVKEHGWATYVTYLLTHPRETVTETVQRFDPMLNPADRDLLPLQPRQPVPRGMFGYWQMWLGAAIALAAAARRRIGRFPPILLMPLIVLAICVPWFYLVALGSGIEHPRHAITVAVTLRIAALIIILVSWEAVTRNDRSTLAGASKSSAS